MVDAFRLGYDPIPEWLFTKPDNISCVHISVISPDQMQAQILTPEGTMQANTGDYIIRGVQGEIYPCKADIFRMTYEEAGEDD